MNEAIRDLEPTSLWNHFADLNAVPRPSKKEEKVIAFIKNFGKSLNLKVESDGIGNVVIRKPATPGMENRKMVVLQSHLDMVHQKNADTDFDFETQGIEMLLAGDWVKAKGTTLGADNGIGVATIMAILSATDLQHPAIEALFTVDEETGMTGAFKLKEDWLQGEILLNLDTEEDDEIGVGCAGGIDVTAEKEYIKETTPSNMKGYQIKITGLSGGHSGMDIHKGLGNANKIMNRLLIAGTKYKLRISSIKGGSLRNAIPRESFATVAVDFTTGGIFKESLETLAETIKREYIKTDPELNITIENTELAKTVLDEDTQIQLLEVLKEAHNGVFAMSESIPDLVETSNNIAKVSVEDGTITIECLARSSKESGKEKLVAFLKDTFSTNNFKIKTGGDYPGWEPNMDSAILKVLDSTYQKLNGKKAHIAACHAGLECGIIGQHYPEMDMISFGPTIKGAHSPDERVSISSVQKYWKFVKEILEEVPVT